jgi:two-component system, NarL family, nitrate/nitrite response regulator NarL
MRIVICDAHRVFAEALASLLRSAGHDIVGCTVGMAEAAGLVAREQVDACIIDLGVPTPDQAGGLDQVVAGAPRTAFMVVTAWADAASLGRAVAAGVRGVALKDDDFVEIHRVLTVAVNGRPANRPASTAVLSLSARAAMRPGGRRQCDGAQFLTPREREALVRLVRGESTTVMARSMGVRKSTARTHVDAVLTKLGAHSRLEAVAYAVRSGIVDVDSPLESQNSMNGSRAVSG